MKKSELKQLIRQILNEQGPDDGRPTNMKPGVTTGGTRPMTLGDAVSNWGGTSSCSQQDMMNLINNDRGLDMNQPVKATPAHLVGYGIVGCVLIGRYYGWW